MINIASALRINEIMYNPEGEDNNKEYVEIYSKDLNRFGFWIEFSI